MNVIKRQMGFTLIELLIVVLIIGLLSSIAIPVFNGQREKAKDSVAKSTVRTGLTAISSLRIANNDSFSKITEAALNQEEPSLQFRLFDPNNQDPWEQWHAGNNGLANKDKIVTFGYMSNEFKLTTNPLDSDGGIYFCTASKGSGFYCIAYRTKSVNRSDLENVIYYKHPKADSCCEQNMVHAILRVTTPEPDSPLFRPNGYSNW